MLNVVYEDNSIVYEDNIIAFEENIYRVLIYCIIIQHYYFLTQLFRNLPEELQPIAKQFFQRLSPLSNHLQDAFNHLDGPSETCSKCKKSGNRICDEGYVFLNKTHYVICAMLGPNTKKYKPSTILRKVANDIYEGILHTEEHRFRDKEFDKLHKKLKLDHPSNVRENERHFKVF